MAQATQKITSAQIRRYAPLGKLSDEDAQELLRTSITTELSSGTPVFTVESEDRQVFYLVRGEIELQLSNDQIQIIKSGTREALKPIGRHLPGQLSATALTDVVLISFDADMLDLFLNWTNPNAYVVNQVDTHQERDWMNRLVKSRGLLRFSEEQIQGLIDRMDEIHFRAGDVVVSQDSNDDYYYVIKSGKAAVSRKPDRKSKDIKLAELKEGDAFGEEALIANKSRGATVTMLEEGDLMRLSKKDFSNLLAQPLLATIPWEEAKGMIVSDTQFIDVRDEYEFEQAHLPNAINIPLPLLRLKQKQLSARNKYIVYCDDGSRSSVAAFLLNRSGFESYILDGGLKAAEAFLITKEMEAEEPAANDLEPLVDFKPMETDAEEQRAAPFQRSDNEVPHTIHYRSMSLADYWGAPVDDFIEKIEDSDALHDGTRTKPVAVPTKPEPLTKKAKILELTPAEKPNAAPASAVVPKKSYAWRNTAGWVIAAGALGAAIHFLAPQPPAPPAPGSQALTTTLSAPQATVEHAPGIRQTPPPAITLPEPAAPAAPESDKTVAPDTGVYLSEEGEILQLQPLNPTEPETGSGADTESDTAIPPAVDPATRGFIE